MINNSNSSDTNRNTSQGTSPLKQKVEGNPMAKTKLKQYGKKSLAPLVDLLHKYKDQINPYMSALDKGLQGACNAFSVQGQPSSVDAERVVEGWFRDANSWFNGARDKLSTDNPKDLLNYLEEQARDKPGLMFATSYVAGLVFGRLGRHIGRIKARSTSSSAMSNMSMQSTLQH